MHAMALAFKHSMTAWHKHRMVMLLFTDRDASTSPPCFPSDHLSCLWLHSTSLGEILAEVETNALEYEEHETASHDSFRGTLNTTAH